MGSPIPWVPGPFLPAVSRPESGPGCTPAKDVGGGGGLDPQGSAGLQMQPFLGLFYMLISSFIFCSELFTLYFST